MLKKNILYITLALTITAPIYVNNVCANTLHSNSVQTALSDTAITAKVKALISQSKTVKNLDIHVTTVNHVVMLEGKVATRHQYEDAIMLADSVNSVKNVNVENLHIKSSRAPLVDAYTTAKVKSMFLKEKIFGEKSIEVWPVKVETKNAVVYLTGKVQNQTQKNRMTSLAQHIQGVKSVDNTITVL